MLFRSIDDEGERQLQFLGSVVQSSKITMGTLLEEFVCELVTSSREFTSVKHGVKVDVSCCNAGSRKKHVVDIMCERGDSISCFNVKSFTRSNTEDPCLLVELYVAAREETQRLNPGKHVSYQMLRIGGTPIPIYDERGVTTLDLNGWLSTLCSRTVNVEREMASLRPGVYVRSAKKLCKSLGLPASYGLDLLATYRIRSGA